MGEGQRMRLLMEETERGFQQTKYYKTTKQRRTPDNSTKRNKQNWVELTPCSSSNI